jgi:DNA-binding NarL/FixJ family response regulator
MHILIADDHAVVRRGLRDILADEMPAASFSEAGNGDELLRLLSGCQAGLVVLDLNMPGRGGLDVLPVLKQDYPQIPVIVMSVYPEDQYALPCLKAGASAYLNKDCATEELAIVAKKILAEV